MENENDIRVLVCPLGWGLGHASRLVPIISLLQSKGCKVIFAGDNPQLRLISYRFPEIQTIVFPSFHVSLSRRKSQLIPLIGIAFRLPYRTIREHYVLTHIVKENQVNLIISDNRYGLWCKGVKSVFITHQIKVIFPKPFSFLEPLGVKAIRFLSGNYDYCFVPDFEGEDNLAGELSHPAKVNKNVKYIEPLSRFQGLKIEGSVQAWDLVGIASGPSPQREIFIDQIKKLSKASNLKTLIIEGNPAEGMDIKKENEIYSVGHLNDNDFANAIVSSKYLITRAGYSTIMDLFTLSVSGLIVPTPGQTEQEYLAEYLSGKGLFKTCKQSDLLKIDVSIAQTIYKPSVYSNDLLEKYLQEVLSLLI